MAHTPTIPTMTLDSCSRALHAQDPNERQIIITAITLDEPIVKVGTVQDLADMIKGIREERIDACDPIVCAPDPYMPTRLVPLGYEIEGEHGAYTVTVKWPLEHTGRGYFTLDMNA